MRRITLWLFSTVAAVVLLFSYRTSTGGGTGAAVAAVAPATVPPAAGPAPTSTASPSPGTSSSAASGASKTYAGAVAGTRWGDVQVTVTVAGGKITNVAVPTYPNGNGRDAEINAYALPQLVQETLQAQNANINTISGATVTSDGYLQSLQSALAAAGLT